MQNATALKTNFNAGIDIALIENTSAMDGSIVTMAQTKPSAPTPNVTFQIAYYIALNRTKLNLKHNFSFMQIAPVLKTNLNAQTKDAFH